MRSRRAKPGPDTRATRQWICIGGRSGCAARAHRPGWARRAIDALPSPPSPQGARGEDASPDRVLATRHPTWRTRPLAARPSRLVERTSSGSCAWPYGHRLDHDALDLVDSDRVRRPVVELRRLRGGVPGDLLRVFERPPIQQIRRDPRRPERVAARSAAARRLIMARTRRRESARPARGSRRAPRPPDGGPGRRAACRPSRAA